MKSALIVIDVQKYFINENTKALPSKIAQFLSEKAHNFEYIVFFKFQNQSGTNWFKIINWREMTSESETEIATELIPFTEKATVFTKKAAFSIFRVEEFLKFLVKENISKLYLCGMDTHACVYTSMMEAFERGYDVKLIEDLCAASHGVEYHQNAINSIKRNLSSKVVVSSSDLYDESVSLRRC